jgi:transposase
VEVDAGEAGLSLLLTWIGTLGGERLVAVEGAHGFGLPLVRRLLASGEQVVDVPSKLTALGRRSARRRGKDDQGDAVVIARIALREPDLPRVREAHLDADLKLLVDARDQLVAESTRVRNRLHALLLAFVPGYRTHTGALTSKKALHTARSLVVGARLDDPVRARLALSAICRLQVLEPEIAELERDLRVAIQARRPMALLSICGVGSLIAAKLLGETHAVERFPSAAAFAAHTGTAPLPASSGITQRHRLNRGGNRQLNRALFTIAMVQARWEPRARLYLDRKRSEGKSPAESRRCLMRHLAAVVYRAMLADQHPDSVSSLAQAT